MGWSERSKAGDLLSLFSLLYFLTYSTALYHLFKNCLFGGFPGGAVVENLPANAGDAGSGPGLGRSHMPRSN